MTIITTTTTTAPIICGLICDPPQEFVPKVINKSRGLLGMSLLVGSDAVNLDFAELNERLTPHAGRGP